MNEGIFIADNDTLYIADRINHRVVIVSPNSINASKILSVGGGSALNQMNNPMNVMVTADAIYVLDSSNYRVVKWFKNGTNATVVAGVTGSAGAATSNTTFGWDYGLFVDQYGSIYVSDGPNNRVLSFPSNSTSGANGNWIAGTGASGFGWQGFQSPRGIFVDSNQALYVADTSNHRIQKWNSGACYGVTVAGNRVSGNSLKQLNSPSGLVVDSNGYLYISDQGNNRILRWAPDSCAGQCIAGCSMTTGSRPDQLNSPFAVAFDSNGSLYVSDTGYHRVQKFSILNNTGNYQTLNIYC